MGLEQETREYLATMAQHPQQAVDLCQKISTLWHDQTRLRASEPMPLFNQWAVKMPLSDRDDHLPSVFCRTVLGAIEKTDNLATAFVLLGFANRTGAIFGTSCQYQLPPVKTASGLQFS